MIRCDAAVEIFQSLKKSEASNYPELTGVSENVDKYRWTVQYEKG